jgi:hypothetical protein
MDHKDYSTETQDVSPFEPTNEEPSSPPIHHDAHQVANFRDNAPQAAERGFAQKWGFHPGIALLMLVVDTMLFGAAAGTLGASFPISLAAACVLGFITYRAQMRWYGDDSENAGIKAAIVAFLTAIPTPLPAFLYVPAGVVGLFHSWRRKS